MALFSPFTKPQNSESSSSEPLPYCTEDTFLLTSVPYKRVQQEELPLPPLYSRPQLPLFFLLPPDRA